MQTLNVALDSRGYDILIGEGLLAKAGELMLPVLPQKRVIVVTDTEVAPRHLAPLVASLAKEGIRHTVIPLPNGESSKSFAMLERLLDTIMQEQPERKTTLIALGGGVIGDLVGFAAAVLLRGVPFIQIPTTLLAQVDSSVGGKTGINTKFGKNLVGAFYQPKLVIADTGVLTTLPHRQKLAGYAEIVKYGLIEDLAFFEWLEKHGKDVVEGKTESVIRAVHTSCQQKADTVIEDEREAGKRALLNLGHTFGHALEAETGFSAELLHGEAVALGMVLAFRMSVAKSLCSAAEAERVEAHLRHIGLPTEITAIRKEWDIPALIRHCQQDKKVADGRMTFILARGIGKSFITQDVTREELETTWKEAVSRGH
ncbi:MAG: 3-dehydroquinate synthase [Alphaproteobacteria bacterium]|nr:3-dehydroquinate synthase [Alphaproteobacteria bacterium]